MPTPTQNITKITNSRSNTSSGGSYFWPGKENTFFSLTLVFVVVVFDELDDVFSFTFKFKQMDIKTKTYESNRIEKMEIGKILDPQNQSLMTKSYTSKSFNLL